MTHTAFHFWRPGPDLDESHKQWESHLVLGAVHMSWYQLNQFPDGGIGLITEKNSQGLPWPALEGLYGMLCVFGGLWASSESPLIWRSLGSLGLNSGLISY